MDAPQPQVVRYQSDSCRWELSSRPPDARLRAHVSDYQRYREQSGEAVRRKTLPSGNVVMIISLGPAIRIADPASGYDGKHTSFVAGLHHSHGVTEYTGEQDGVQVNLTPLGARLLLGVPGSAVAGQVVALEELLGDQGCELTERLAEAADDPECFALLDAFIGRRVSEAGPPSPAAAWAWRRLTETDGRLRIGALADELGCSRKYLISEFRSHVGLAPKTFARILRFHRARSLIERDDGRRFAEIAHDCGYYDQAHLNRDFREFAGTSPGEHVARLLPQGFGVSGAPERAG